MFARPVLPRIAGHLVALVMMASVLVESDFEGTVISAAGDQLVLSVDVGEYTFVVKDDTRITVDGDEATLKQIAAGYEAKVSATKQGDQWIAKTIRAYTPK